MLSKFYFFRRQRRTKSGQDEEVEEMISFQSRKRQQSCTKEAKKSFSAETKRNSLKNSRAAHCCAETENSALFDARQRSEKNLCFGGQTRTRRRGKNNCLNFTRSRYESWPGLLLWALALDSPKTQHNF